MTQYLMATVVILLLVLLTGLWRVIKGPTSCDRMLATQLFGSAGVAVLMLLATAKQQPALLNTALVLALLAPLTLIAFLRLQSKNDESS